MPEMKFLGQLADFILIIFIYPQFHTRQEKLQNSFFEDVYVTLPSQIYPSYLRDYMTSLVKNIKAFPNAIKK